jgi:lipoprotein-anchoring transpeptidase ErfK/SrfK
MATVPGALRFVLVLALSAMVVTSSPPASAAAPTMQVSHVVPAAGDVVGVAHPVDITFADSVDRTAAEGSIRFIAPEDVAGQFDWLTADTVRFTPDRFWPAHSTIRLSVGNTPLSFNTGSSVVGVADISAHTFTVSVDGEVAREMPASMGKSGFSTPVGSFTALAKERDVVMDSRTIGIPLDSSEGYLLDVNYAVRVTWGGVYVHSAPWSVGSQGYENVSHGCINLSPDNAAWYYDMVSVGDPIVVES